MLVSAEPQGGLGLLPSRPGAAVTHSSRISWKSVARSPALSWFAGWSREESRRHALQEGRR